MDEYTCKKCGEVCVIEYMHDKSPGWPECYCETCEDTPQGFDHSAVQIDWISSAADYAYDKEKDRRMLDSATPEERKRVIDK